MASSGDGAIKRTDLAALGILFGVLFFARELCGLLSARALVPMALEIKQPGFAGAVHLYLAQFCGCDPLTMLLTG